MEAVFSALLFENSKDDAPLFYGSMFYQHTPSARSAIWCLISLRLIRLDSGCISQSDGHLGDSLLIPCIYTYLLVQSSTKRRSATHWSSLMRNWRGMSPLPKCLLSRLPISSRGILMLFGPKDLLKTSSRTCKV